MFVGNAFGGRVMGMGSVEEGGDWMQQQQGDLSIHRWRAGVISSCKSTKGRLLVDLMSSLCLNAFGRCTFLRLGISVC